VLQCEHWLNEMLGLYNIRTANKLLCANIGKFLCVAWTERDA
jgi:hypothetical protein